MEPDHCIPMYRTFRTLAIIVAVAQLLIAIGFLAAGDFGNPLAHSMSWPLPAPVLLFASLSAANKNHLLACIDAIWRALSSCGVATLSFQFGFNNTLTSRGAQKTLR
jgi:hypothetical protein